MKKQRSRCDNCDWKGIPVIKTDDIPDYSERVECGEEEPSGECPKCGELCHYIPPALTVEKSLCAGCKTHKTFVCWLAVLRVPICLTCIRIARRQIAREIARIGEL